MIHCVHKEARGQFCRHTNWNLVQFAQLNKLEGFRKTDCCVTKLSLSSLTFFSAILGDLLTQSAGVWSLLVPRNCVGGHSTASDNPCARGCACPTDCRREQRGGRGQQGLKMPVYKKKKNTGQKYMLHIVRWHLMTLLILLTWGTYLKDK